MTSASAYGSETGLDWSVRAMHDATERVNRIIASDLARAFAAIGEAVWWITIINDTLRHRHREAYDQAVTLMSPNPLATLNGLRSVRNRIGHEVDLVDFIEPVATRPDRGDGRITAWAWRTVPPPVRGERTAGQHSRDITLHRDYETALASQNIWQPFMVATGFFGQVSRVRSGEVGTA